MFLFRFLFRFGFFLCLCRRCVTSRLSKGIALRISMTQPTKINVGLHSDSTVTMVAAFFMMPAFVGLLPFGMMLGASFIGLLPFSMMLGASFRPWAACPAGTWRTGAWLTRTGRGFGKKMRVKK
jgi:hypothetical protein